jgi:protein involved in polysaccharide export with SLBB domain
LHLTILLIGRQRMRRIVIFIITVIILVSLNWFRSLFAQDINSLSEAEKAALLSTIKNDLPAGESRGYYKTPGIYDSARIETAPMGPQAADVSHRASTGVNQSTGMIPFEELRPFGMELFAGPREVLPPNDIAADDDYILGPGDNVIVYMWGRVENEYNLTVDREGKIFIPKIGDIVVWGKNIGEFENIVRRRLQAAYTGFDLTVSLGKIRSIRIYLTGEVRSPGAYTVSSLTSLFNALYLAGGPNDNGSMRAIRLMRGGKKVAEVDLYRFLLEGDNSVDIRLESGDAIFIPVAGARVAIRGEVVRPGIYELKGDETIDDLLRLAGGATARAHLERVMLERISSRDEWEVLDLNLTEMSRTETSVPLHDGDRATVFSIFDAKKNMVAIYGQVKHPGYYERSDSLRVSDLIARASLQDYDVHYERANLFRRHSDWRTEIIPLDLRTLDSDSAADVLLQDRDSLHIYSIQDVTWEKFVHIDGEVNKPGEYPYYDGMTVNDLIFLAGSFTRAASRFQAEVARFNEFGDVDIEYVRLSDAQGEETRLQENDRVYIRQIPQWRFHRTVTLEGEIQYPGEYVLNGNEETLYDLIQRAGGFTSNAFPRGTVFERRSIEKTLERLRIRQQIESSTVVEEDSLGNLRNTTPLEIETGLVNRIVIDVETIMASEGKSDNVTLEPGDRIFVPSVPSGISVLGAVGNNGTIKYREGANGNYYIKRAGNFTPRADEDAVRLIRANGEVLSGGGTLGKKIHMGDILYVPPKVERHGNFTKTLTTVLSITTGALTTALLVTKL